MAFPAQTPTQEIEPQRATQNDPLDDLVDSLIEDVAYIVPALNHVLLEPGDSIEFEVYPVLSAFDTITAPALDSTLLFAGNFTISAACTSISVPYEAILPEGLFFQARSWKKRSGLTGKEAPRNNGE